MKAATKKRKYLAWRKTEMCKTHSPHDLGYIAWFEDAERRYKIGERQKRCPVCKHYFWKDEL